MLLAIASVLAGLSLLALAVSPVVGIPLVFISKPFIDTQFEDSILLGLKLTEIVAALVPLVVFGHMLFARPAQALSRMPLKLIWMIYAVDVLFFSLIIVDYQNLRAGANVFFRHISAFVSFYMIQAFFHQDKDIKLLLVAIIAAGLFPMGIGVYQMASGTVWRYEETEGIVRNIGLWHDSVNIRQYAAQTILALLLYGALYIGKKFILKAGALVYLGIATAVIAKTYSKAGYLSLGIWAICWSVLQKKYAAFSLLVGVGALLVTYFGGEFLANSYQMFHKEIGFISGTVEKTRTFAGRWYGWQDMMMEWERFHWLAKVFGSGKVATEAHNDYLQILFHGGLFGLGIYISLLAIIGLRIINNLRRKIDPMAVATLMLFLMWLVDTIGLVPSAYPAYQWFVWGFIGLSLRLRSNEESREQEESEFPNTIERDNQNQGDLLVTQQATSGRRYSIISE